MNNTLDVSLETNFNSVMNLSESSYCYDELIAFLKSDNILEKQLAALELNEIKFLEDARILVSNLIGQDGKVREAVAFKVNELIQMDMYRDFFNSEDIFKLMLEGIMDINGNVCRQICGVCSINSQFNSYLAQNLPDKIFEILKNIKKLSSDEKQYKISKRNFQLYWCLEALYDCLNSVDISKVTEILTITAEFEDYTIREKTAKILSKLESSALSEIRAKLKIDENYYVRRYL